MATAVPDEHSALDEAPEGLVSSLSCSSYQIPGREGKGGRGEKPGPQSRAVPRRVGEAARREAPSGSLRSQPQDWSLCPAEGPSTCQAPLPAQGLSP